MAPSAPAAQPQPARPNRVPRPVLIIHRAYSAADIATNCCPYHSLRMMTKAHWLVRQLPLEKYRRWKRRSRGLSTPERIEFAMFARLWTFMLVDVGDSIEEEEGPLRAAYEEVMDELDRSFRIRLVLGYSTSTYLFTVPGSTRQIYLKAVSRQKATSRMATSTELSAAEAHLARFTEQARVFVRPENEDTQRTPPMSLAMILIINSLVFLRRLETLWPYDGRHHTLSSLMHILEFQSGLLDFLVSLPTADYVDQLTRLDQLSDKQMEELRWFYLLVDELGVMAGLERAGIRQSFIAYAKMASDRAATLITDANRICHILEGYVAENGALSTP